MKQILITGGTGVVGSELVPRYLKIPGTRVHLLIRGESDEVLRKRAANLWDYWRAGSAIAENDRVHFYLGDVCRPNLGLSCENYNRLRRLTTHVVHCAGNVKLNQSLADARRSAVESAREIIRFCFDDRQSLPITKVDVLSTIGVAGRMQGLVPERRLVEPRSYHNTYEAAKAEAEELYWDAIKGGAPLTIHRPSMIVGDSRTGRTIRAQVFSYLADFLSGRRTWGILPRLGSAKLDIVPADFIADAVVASNLQLAFAGRVLHLCSGPGRELSLLEFVAKAREFYKAIGESLPPLRFVSQPIYRIGVAGAARVLRGPRKRSLSALVRLLDYLGQEQVFATSETETLLHTYGSKSAAPPHPSKYLDHVLGFHRIPT